MICLRLVYILLIFGTIVALLVSTSSQMVSASVDGGSPGPSSSNSNQEAAEGCSPIDPRCNTENPDSSSSSGASSNSNQQAIYHINQAQSALQNGDTEGAQIHMDSAKKALICNPGDPTHC